MPRCQYLRRTSTGARRVNTPILNPRKVNSVIGCELNLQLSDPGCCSCCPGFSILVSLPWIVHVCLCFCSLRQRISARYRTHGGFRLARSLRCSIPFCWGWKSSLS